MDRGIGVALPVNPDGGNVGVCSIGVAGNLDAGNRTGARQREGIRNLAGVTGIHINVRGGCAGGNADRHRRENHGGHGVTATGPGAGNCVIGSGASRKHPLGKFMPIPVRAGSAGEPGHRNTGGGRPVGIRRPGGNHRIGRIEVVDYIDGPAVG
ncbi:MAG: hypothetical protein WC560_12650, partial [Syntrophales bacterium]